MEFGVFILARQRWFHQPFSAEHSEGPHNFL